MAASEQPSDIVLYIEDNPVNLKLAIILVDLSMPGMDGFQVLEILKTEPELADTPIIAMSAHALPEDIHRGKAEASETESFL